MSCGGTKNPNRWGVGAEAGAALRPATAMASYGFEDGYRVENIFAAELSTPNTFCVRSILVKIWWSVRNEAAMIDIKGCPFVLGFLLYWIFLKHHAILTVFDSVGPQKRSQALSMLPCIKLYICNIK